MTQGDGYRDDECDCAECTAPNVEDRFCRCGHIFHRGGCPAFDDAEGPCPCIHFRPFVDPSLADKMGVDRTGGRHQQ